MKKYINKILLGFISISLISCSGDDDPNTPSGLVETTVVGVKMLETLDASDLTTSKYVANLRVYGDESKFDKYQMDVYLIAGGVEEGPVTFNYTKADFPVTIDWTGEYMALLFNKPTADLSGGDSFRFDGTVTLTDGTTYNAESKATDNEGSIITINNDDFELFPSSTSTLDGGEYAFDYSFVISCPGNSFDAQEAEGTYTVTQHRFDAFFPGAVSTREVIAGPGENQLTIVGGAVVQDGADDLIIEVNPVDNTLSYAGLEDAIHFNTFGPGNYGAITGTMFGCAGKMDMTIITEGFIDNYLTLEKQ